MILQDLQKLPIYGVYLLLNEQDKRVYISTSQDLLTSLNRILRGKEYEEIVKDITLGKLQLIMLDEIQDRNIQSIRLGYWIKWYRNNGFMLYKESKTYPKWRLDIEVVGDLFQVSVRNKRTEIVVGLFVNKDDTDSFVSRYYPDGVDNLIYDTSYLTRHASRKSDLESKSVF